MKKLAIILILFITFFVVHEEKVEANSKSYIFTAVNDELVFMDVAPFVEKGTTYVPVRMFEHLGMNIIWNGEERSVLLEYGERSITILIDSNELVTFDGQIVEFSSQLKEGNTMVPYRLIAEYFEFQVSFIPEGPVARVVDLTIEEDQEDNIEETSDENIIEEDMDENNDILIPIRMSDEEFYQHHEKKIIEVKEEIKRQRELELQKQEELNKSKKVAYITLDDGPNNNTPTILNILKKHDAKATFFVLEPNAKRYQDVMKRTIEEGHTIACHGVTHDKNKVYRNPQAVVNEMQQCQTTVKNITGISSNLVRVPYGSVPYMKEPYRVAMKNAGFKMWDWNVDSLDWKYSSDQVVTHTLAQVNTVEKRGEAPVILLHNLQASTNALERIVVDLKNRGYELRGLTEDMVS